jgi:acetyltransferase-like isoleucine patch superfamily enzyme
MIKGIMSFSLTKHFKWLVINFRHLFSDFTLFNNSYITSSKIGKKVVISESSKIYNTTVGNYTYFGSNCSIVNSEIGSFCSIASEVVINPGKHPTNLFSTHPISYKNKSNYLYYNEFPKVEIGNDVWIGIRSIIMGGIKIGNGAIIAAGSVVTKDVEAYSIVGGIPAKFIKFRLSEKDRIKIPESNWWNKNLNDINKIFK